ncbi:hypothetical protein [Microcoleus sp. F4-D5]|uniref:hypothetical protein n=1 Tax=Microcoleus sp. F4-D5 TaxID=2818760 RepID=UPI002FD15CBC
MDYPIIFRCFGDFGGSSNSSLHQNGIAQTANPTLSVDVKADRHSISPDIYGVNKISTWNFGLRVYKYGFRATYPANSMTLVAIPKANS